MATGTQEGSTSTYAHPPTASAPPCVHTNRRLCFAPALLHAQAPSLAPLGWPLTTICQFLQAAPMAFAPTVSLRQRTFLGLFSQLCLLTSPSVTVKLACLAACVEPETPAPSPRLQAIAAREPLEVRPLPEGDRKVGGTEHRQVARTLRKTLEEGTAVAEGWSAESSCNLLPSQARQQKRLLRELAVAEGVARRSEHQEQTPCSDCAQQIRL